MRNRSLSVKTGTVMHRSHIGFQKWAIAIYLWSVSLKGVSSMRLHRDLKITQKSAYFMAQRLREAWTEGHGGMAGPVEIDETHIDGKEIATREVCLDGKRNDQMAFHALAESKIMSSDGCNGNRVPLEMGPWYDFRKFGCHLGNVGV